MSLHRHAKVSLSVDGRDCTIVVERRPEVLLVQPVDGHDLEELDNEVAWIEHHADRRFVLATVPIRRWNEELTPWPAPPVFGKTPFGSGAGETLAFITDKLVPTVAKQYFGIDIDGMDSAVENSKTLAPENFPVILGGYSLAGLFALWAGTQHPFQGIVAASPSVWYPQWLAFSETHCSKAPFVYLSLGDTEHRSRTPIMATVDDCIHRQLDILKAQGTRAVLEMNPGNHFQDNGVRTAKGFVCVL